MKVKLILPVLFLLLLSSLVSADLTNKNVFYASLDEGASDDLGNYDVDNTSVTITNVGCKIENCSVMDGSSSVFNLSRYAIDLNSYSICAWVKRDTTSTTDTIIGRNGGAPGDSFLLNNFQPTTNTMQNFVYVSNTAKGSNPTYSGDSTTWTYLCHVADSNSLLMYFNASLIQNVSTGGAFDFGSCTTIGFGANIDPACTGYSDYFDGKMDEVSIWNRTLSLNEVEELYNNGSGNNFYSNITQEFFGVTATNIYNGSDITDFTVLTNESGQTNQTPPLESGFYTVPNAAFLNKNATLLYNSSVSGFHNITLPEECLNYDKIRLKTFGFDIDLGCYDSQENLLTTLIPNAFSPDNGIEVIFNGEYKYYNTTDSSVTTDILSNSTSLYTVSVIPKDFFSDNRVDYNVSENLEGQHFQVDLRMFAQEIFTNNSLTGNFTIGSLNGIQNESFYIDAGLYNVTFTNSSYFNKTLLVDLSIFDNISYTIEDVYDMLIYINASDRGNGSAILEFNVTVDNNIVNLFYNTSDGNITLEALQGLNYTIFGQTLNYFNQTEQLLNANNFYENVTLRFTRVGQLTVRVFDIDAVPITANVDLTLRDASTETKYNFTGGVYTLDNLEEGTQYSLIVESAGYESQGYIFTYTNDLAQDFFDVYLSDEGINVTFSVLESSGDVLPDVSVRVFGFINGTTRLVGERITDGVGEVVFSLRQGQPYSLVFSKSGFITNTVGLNINRDAYTINMQGISAVDFEGPVSGVFYDYNPKNESLVSAPQDFTWTVFRDNLTSNFSIIGIDLYNGSTLLNATFSNNPQGGTLILNYNLSDFSGSNITAVYYFQKDNFIRYELPVNYKVVSSVNESDVSQVREWAIENLQTDDKIITWYLIIIFLALLLKSLGLKNTTNSFMTLGVAGFATWPLGFYTPAEWVAAGAQILLALIVLLAIIKRRGEL